MRSRVDRSELREDLLGHARRLVARQGAAALTMRALAAEAGCAVGLPYKAFVNREDLVTELILGEYRRLKTGFDDLVAGAGTGTVGGNIARYARLLLDSPVVPLSAEIGHDPASTRTVNDRARDTGLVAALTTTVVDYLTAERRLGRVARDVDVAAFGFLIAGAVHNLLASGDGYPRPSRRRLDRMLAAVADRLAPASDLAPTSDKERPR